MTISISPSRGTTARLQPSTTDTSAARQRRPPAAACSPRPDRLGAVLAAIWAVGSLLTVGSLATAVCRSHNMPVEAGRPGLAVPDLDDCS